MPSGLLFIVILTIWAVILVPRMVRMYDQHATQRTTRRFRHAMSSLGGSRRTQRPVDVMMVRRVAPVRRATVGVLLDSAVDLHLDHGVDPFLAESTEGDDAREQRLAARRRASRTAVARRRRVMVGLFGGAAVLALLGVLGVLPMWAPMAPTLMLTVMVAVSRRHARQMEQWRQDLRLRAEQRRQRSEVDVVPMAPVVAVRRRVEESGGGVLGSVHPIGLRGQRRGMTPAQARLAEQYRALSATYVDTEDELGLDDYVGGSTHADVDELPRLRAVNE